MRVLVLIIALLLPWTPALAGRDDHERVREAVQAGEILPLRTILDRAEAAYPGDFVAAELEDEDGRLVYEIKLLASDGRVLKLLYDARSGALLDEKQRGPRR